ncbi:hypothetical protein [Paenibacillus sp. R14(2021)]|uniref:hypothetical protein n=1 Tax=Paenibacillus sp. R14(2021) TaxID=2859228 RepID=UPI001C6113C3|nr:hypothetical protein [Paenibacillus sp. R14(2021)]
MRKIPFIARSSVFLLLAASMLALTGCSQASALKSFVSQKAHAILTKPDTIPVPQVVSAGKPIPVTQSTYCWGNRGCADYAGGKIMLQGKQPAVVTPGAAIQISIPYQPAPAQVDLTQYLDGNAFSSIPMTGGQFHAPEEPGVYDYGISAFWKSEDGKYAKGDTSVVFAIEVQ